MSGLPRLIKGVIAACVGVGLFHGKAHGLTEQGSADQMRVIWRHAVNTGPLPLGCRGTPAIGTDGTIYVPASNFLYAFDPDGSEKWSQGETRGLTTLGDVAIDDQGTVYTQSNALSALRPDGSLKWRIPDAGKNGAGFPSVAVGQDNTVYLVHSRKLWAVGMDGAVKWEREIGFSSLYSPVIDSDGTIYSNGTKRINAFGADGKLRRAFSRSDADLLASFEPGIDQFGNLYFGGHKNFYAVDSRGGLRWTFKTDDYVPHSPAIAPDGTIYFGCADGNLYAVNSSGELKWKFRTNGRVSSAPAIDSQGNIYFTSWDKNFYCLDSNGSLKSVVRVTFGYGSPIIAADGTIYLVDVGYVYAIAGFAPPSPGPWPMKRHDAQGTGRVLSLDANAERTDIQR